MRNLERLREVTVYQGDQCATSFMKQVKYPIKNSTIEQTPAESVFLVVSFAFVSWDRRNTYKNNAWEENIRMILV